MYALPNKKAIRQAIAQDDAEREDDDYYPDIDLSNYVTMLQSDETLQDTDHVPSWGIRV